MAKRWMHLGYLPSVESAVLNVEHKILKEIYTEWNMAEELQTVKSSLGLYPRPSTSIVIGWRKRIVHNSPISTGTLRRYVLEKAKQLNRFGADYAAVSLCPHGCSTHRVRATSSALIEEAEAKQVLPMVGLEQGDRILQVHPVTYEPAAPFRMGSVISKVSDYQIVFKEWDSDSHYTIEDGSKWIILTPGELSDRIEEMEEARQKAEEEANALLPLNSGRRISLDF